jgi:hypothetical protein
VKVGVWCAISARIVVYINMCATSYVTADNSRPMAYLILKVICNERIKTDLSKNDVYFIPKIELYIV